MMVVFKNRSRNGGGWAIAVDFERRTFMRGWYLCTNIHGAIVIEGVARSKIDEIQEACEDQGFTGVDRL